MLARILTLTLALLLFCLLAGPATAQCTSPLGDVNSQDGVDVVDIQCTIMAALWELSGDTQAPLPSCLTGSIEDANIDCTGTINVVDALLVISLALGDPLPDALDSNQDGQPDSCEALCASQQLSFTVVPFQVPEWKGTAKETVLFKSEATFVNYFGVAPPSGLNFANQWALFYSEGWLPFPGTVPTATGLSTDGNTLELQVDLQTPGDGCQTLYYTQPVSVLVALEPTNSDESTASASVTQDPFDCTEEGAFQGMDCSTTSLCGPDLICTALTKWTFGFCRPTWMWALFKDLTPALIPDGDPDGLVRQSKVSGLASVDEDVIVTLELDHPDPSDLVITLTNPDGNETLVWDNESFTDTATVIQRRPKGLSGDESVNGTWSLKVVDTAPGNSGSLEWWTLEITSRWD